MAACVNHKSKKNCAWNNANYHPEHPKKEQFRACFYCQGPLNKGAYQAEQKNSSYSWNIHHKDSDPYNNICKNLVATHPDCNLKLG